MLALINGFCVGPLGLWFWGNVSLERIQFFLAAKWLLSVVEVSVALVGRWGFVYVHLGDGEVPP